ncbi:MAG: hypothetical protein L0Y72_05895 [Gemmataceae bacterium]|nr:hypothetical protein [Gemmataceae bacterium]
MPRPKEDRLLDLPEHCRVDNFAAMDAQTNFAQFALAWNELGVGVQIEVRGKSNPPQADASRPRGSDGLTLWLDTRESRASHRGTRYCHQFHFLPTGGGAERDQPAFVQSKINRALEDAPLAAPQNAMVRAKTNVKGYLLEAFLPAAVLNGYDPEQHPRLGFYYSVKDEELGEQVLSVGPEFPFWEDPSLWSVLELVR